MVMKKKPKATLEQHLSNTSEQNQQKNKLTENTCREKSDPALPTYGNYTMKYTTSKAKLMCKTYN